MLVILSVLMADYPLFAAPSEDLERAQAAWQNREQPGELEEAIRLWDQAFKADPSHAELLIDLTKACGRAVRHASTSADKRRWADQAKAYGAKAVRVNPKSSDAYAAYGEALGQ